MPDISSSLPPGDGFDARAPASGRANADFGSETMHRFLKWREVLQGAPNAKAVDALMRDYLESLGSLAAVLPPACRRALAGDLDVQAAAVTLLHAELHYEGSDDGRLLLHEVAHTFASAAVRITLLHAHPIARAD